MSDEKPERGTRPANRRSLILDAAADLFANRGYEHVTIGEIADQVAVGPSALYRHFASKEQILSEVLSAVIGRFNAVVNAEQSSAEALRAVATFCLDHRSVGVLWRREARHLPDEAYQSVRAEIRRARESFASNVTGRPLGPGSSAALAVLLSPSFHHVELERPAFDALLATLAARALVSDLPDAPPPREPAPGRTRTSRRERLVATGMRLFAERSYAAIRIEDVAAEVGLAASSVYNHLPTKQEILIVALTRADGYLQVEMDRILASTPDSADALRGLTESYAQFAWSHPDLVDALVSEVQNLPPSDEAYLRSEQRGYVEEWVDLLRSAQPGLSAPTARITVHAALTVTNDLAVSSTIRTRSDGEWIAAQLSGAILGV